MKRIGVIILLCSAMLTVQAAVPGSTSGPQTASAAPGDSPGAASDPIAIVINGQAAELSDRPIMKDGTVYVPLRGLLTALGAEVDWDAATGHVTTRHHGQSVTIRAGSDQADVNGQSVTLDRPPFQLAGVTYVSVRWLNEAFGATVRWQGNTRTVAVYYPDEQLPVVGSFEELQALLADAVNRSGSLMTMRIGVTADMVAQTTAESAAPMEMKSKADAGSASGDYSATNVQVQGVDEADVVKTDGRYIYQVNQQRILITSAVPADQMRTVASLQYADGSFTPQELYVDDERLIVIGSGSPPQQYPVDAVPLAVESKKMIMPILPYVQTTVAIVYDISDIAAPRETRRLELEGGYLSSRKIGDSLYLISNKYLDYYGIRTFADGQAEDGAEGKEASYQPMIRDSAVHGELTPVPFADIRYFPGFIEPNYMLVAGVDLSATGADQPMDVQTFLGSGHNVYASTEHLYVAVSQYEQLEATPAEADGQSGKAAADRVAPYTEKTAVYKFSLQPDGVVYMAEGSVPGRILNQFSMDEYEGHFRIATTTGHVWGSEDNLSKNNLYVLGDALQQVGRIEDIAPGEQIYSVRFAGKRAYMVTFRTVDPLFVIDVANPSEPKILGALKIPGYSDYLHPYDEHHIIGFGKDTVEVSVKDSAGREIGVNAYYLGMKVALFDVTDVANPKELHKVNIGDRGTHSELLYNHKALLFDKEKDLLAFPVDLYEVDPNAKQQNGMPAHGNFAYQGAYVYKLDPANGFQLRGRITHISDEELKKAGNYWYSDKNVNRILYIGDHLYTLSGSMIKANRLSDLGEAGSLAFPAR